MGIDARMFARIRRRDRLTADEVLAAAREMAATLGAANFLITKGRPEFEGVASWPTHHALSIVRPLTADDVEGFEDAEALVGKIVWLQDGDPIIAEEGEQFIEAHLFTRYYGEGYARGDWMVIRSTAEWLERRFPGCEVWYGGDSSGVCAERFDAAAREEVNRFFLDSGHSTYGRSFSDIFDKGNAVPVCGTCEARMHSCGGGPGETFWYCDGCSGKAKSAGSEITFIERGKDFFDIPRPPSA